VDAEEVTRLRVVLTRLARRLRQTAGPGITPSQLSVLFTVDRSGPLTPGELADLEEVQPPTVSRIIGGLEGDGLVTRTAAEGDRRTAVVAITPAGRKTLSQIQLRRDVWLARRTDSLNERDGASLAAALPVLERLLGE